MSVRAVVLGYRGTDEPGDFALDVAQGRTVVPSTAFHLQTDFKAAGVEVRPRDTSYFMPVWWCHPAGHGLYYHALPPSSRHWLHRSLLQFV